MGDLVERLERRAEDDQACAENSMAVFEALGEHYRAFDERSGRWNTYAVRMAVEHKNGGERDAQHAADLREMVAELRHLREENARIRRETIEEAAKVADRAAAGASLEAKALRALKDYSRSKQLDMESAACVNLAAAIRALAQQREGK